MYKYKNNKTSGYFQKAQNNAFSWMHKTLMNARIV